MATPIIRAALDQANYEPGSTMTLTATYAVDRKTGTVTVVVTNGDGESSEPSIVPYVIGKPIQFELVDSEGREFVKVSDTGSVAVFTATA